MLILVLGLSLTFFLYQQAMRAALNALKSNFDFESRDVLLKVENRLDTYAQVLRGVRGLFNASKQVTREEFYQYTHYQNLPTYYPGIQGVGFALAVPGEQIKQHVAEIRQQGFPDYNLHPDHDRAFYTSIIYLEPFTERNQRAFGYDMYSDPIRQQAMIRARDQDELSLSAKVKLMQETDRDIQAGFLMYLPVYRNGSPTQTIEERQANLVGWAYAPFRMNDFLNGILAEQNQNLDLAIFDGESENDSDLMHGWSSVDGAGNKARFQFVTTRVLMGHPWTLKIRSTPIFEASLEDTAAWLIVISGLSISVLLSLLVHVLIQSRSRALRDAEELRIAATVFESQEGMFVTDSETRILRVNQAFTQLTGYRFAEVVGKTPRILKSNQHHPAFYTAFWASLKEQGHWEGEIINRRKNGMPFPEDLSITSVKNSKGIVTHYVAVFRDITQKKQAELAIIANKAKSAFLANMSHEIRTPMNGVIGMLEILSKTPLDDRQQQMLEIIHHSAQNQLNILNDILDFSKIEAGKLELSPEITDVETLIENTCYAQEAMAVSKRVNLKLYVDPGIPRCLIADGLRLSQVLNNLINNAIKFSSMPNRLGAVKVRAELQQREADKVWLKFIVSDNGIGMDVSTQGRLFQYFEQADPSTTRRFGGTGLGLAITHQLTELMQGSISVDSEPQKGTTFCVRLPLQASIEQSVDESPSIEGMDCWVICDEEQTTRDLCRLIEYAGARVQAISPLDLKAIPQPDQEALLIQVMVGDAMPTTAEIEAVAPQWHKPRLIILQKNNDCGRRRKPRKLNDSIWQLDATLLTRRNLLAAMAIATGRLELDAAHAQVLMPSDRSLPLNREEALRNRRWLLVAEDHEINQEVIRHQLQLLGYGCDIAADGRQALALWEQQDYALLLTDLHMPELDGYQLCEAIRRREQTENRIRTPIIALTAIALKGEKQHCIEMGMDDCLTKPTPLSLLKTKLDQWLLASAMLAAKASNQTMQADAQVLDDEPVCIWDDQALSKLVGNTPETHQHFLTLFLDKIENAVDSFQAAQEAGDTSSIASTAHALKAAARSVGAMRLGETCQALETAGKANDINACRSLISDIIHDVDNVKPMLQSRRSA